jgi:hypothetical protein
LSSVIGFGRSTKEIKINIMSSIKHQLLTFSILLMLVTSAVFPISAENKIYSSSVLGTSDFIFNEFSNELRLTTPKNSYKTGETVNISGEGFGKFEEVSISVEQVDKAQETSYLMANWTIFADESGVIAADWIIPVGGRFTIKAVGGESKLEVQTTIACPDPIKVSGNPNCASLNASNDPVFSHITSNYGLKIDPPASGSFTFTDGTGRSLTGGAPSKPNHSLTIALQNSKTFNWSSTRGIDAIIVKGGSYANVYPFDPESLNDQGLTTAGSHHDISHIEVCFDNDPASIRIIKDSQPNTSQAFSFTANGQIGTTFSLMDVGISGPNQRSFGNIMNFGAGSTVKITENFAAGPYSLTQISCTSNGTGTENNTVNIQSRFVTVMLEEGENVVCRFVNAIPTAAAVSVGGGTYDQFGNPIARTMVTVQDMVTMDTQTVYTNSFGRYRFDNLEVGHFYVFTVSTKRYAFTPDSHSFVLNDAMENLNFTASGN